MSVFSSLRRLFRRPSTQAQAPATTSATAVVELPLPGPGGIHLRYEPRRNGSPDAGEVVWAWVPYQEDPTRGKDRPLLVIGRESAERCYALKLTSKPREGDRDHLPIGAGAWDREGRPSWVDIDQLYSVHRYGIRREAASVDPAVFRSVAEVLAQRYGWTAQ